MNSPTLHNTEFHCCIHMNLLPCRTMSPINPLHLPSGLFPTGFSHQKHVLIFLLHYTCHMLHPPLLPWFDHPSNIWWGVQTIKLFIMQFSPVSCHILPVWCSIFFNILFFPYCQDQVPHPHKSKVNITVLYTFIFLLFDSTWEDKRFWTKW